MQNIHLSFSSKFLAVITADYWLQDSFLALNGRKWTSLTKGNGDRKLEPHTEDPTQRRGVCSN